jgi:hypothetical protein
LLDTLVNPPFAQNPPFNVNAKTVGLVVLILGIIGGILGLIALPFVLAIGAFAAAAGAGPLVVLALPALLVNIAANVLAIWGGYRMWQGETDGKRLVIYALALSFIATLVYGLGVDLAGQLFTLIVLAVVYYIVVISRFPGEVVTERRSGP